MGLLPNASATYLPLRLAARMKVGVCLSADKQTPTFIRAAKRNGRYVAEALGNRPITSYSSSDAAAFRDYLLDKGLALGSVKRIFGSVRSIINLVMIEHGIEGSNGHYCLQCHAQS